MQTALDQAPRPFIIDQGAHFPDLKADFLPEDCSYNSALLIMPLMGKSTHEDQGAIILGFITLQRDQAEIWSQQEICLLYTSPSPRDLSTSRMPSSA